MDYWDGPLIIFFNCFPMMLLGGLISVLFWKNTSPQNRRFQFTTGEWLIIVFLVGLSLWPIWLPVFGMISLLLFPLVTTGVVVGWFGARAYSEASPPEFHVSAICMVLSIIFILICEFIYVLISAG